MLKNNRIIFFMALLSIFLLYGCGQKVVETVTPIKTTVGRDDAKAVIVILPLADYSAGNTIDSPLRRQVKVREAIAYRLVQHGYYPPAQEDVTQYLTTHNIDITVADATINDGARQALEREMSAGWSEKIKAKVNGIVAANDQANAYITGRYDRLGLSQGVLKGIGNHFGANYVLRGRIIEYRITDTDSAIFELALMLQDIGTGKIVWANRIREEVRDNNYLWNGPEERQQIDVAIDQAVDKLVKDLASTLEKLPVGSTEYGNDYTVEQNPLPKGSGSPAIMEEPVENNRVKEENPANWGS